MKRLYALAVLALSVYLFACGDDDTTKVPEPCACGTDAVEFSVGNSSFYLPNAFTPNSDGINDLFFPFASSDVETVEAFVVSSPDGETLYEYYNFPPNEVQFSWDGGQFEDSVYVGNFKYTLTVKNANGDDINFTGSGCSFLCDGEEEIENFENCKFGTQNNGEGELDITAPHFKSECF